MRVKHRFQIGALFVDGKVKGILNRRSVQTDDCTIGFDLHDVLTAQVSLVNTAGADPDRSL